MAAVAAVPAFLPVDDRKLGVVQDFLEEIFPRVVRGDGLSRAKTVVWKLGEHQTAAITRVVLQGEDIESYARQVGVPALVVRRWIKVGLNTLKKEGPGVREIMEAVQIGREKGFL